MSDRQIRDESLAIRVVSPGSNRPTTSEVRTVGKTVCVVGLGYIGLPTAAVLADRGHHVHGVDVRRNVIDTINQGGIHIHEPGLPEIVQRVVRMKRLRAELFPAEANVFVICVPTPVTEDKCPDLSCVEQAAREIRPYVRAGNLIILESTSPPGTTRDVVVRHAVPEGLTVGRDVFVAHCPERVLPGRILIELVQNDRVVGGVTAECTRRAVAFYQSFVTGAVLPTTAVGAEIVKLAENSYRDVNIAFANELAALAEQLGADVFEVIRLANRHPRVKILNPGPGVGGHCISVDPWFLVEAAPNVTPLIRAARGVNDARPSHIVAQIEALVRRHDIKSIGCLGLAYKADIDDLRESPSLTVVRELHARRVGELLVCEPYVDPMRFSEFPLHSLEAVLERSELIVLLTDHAPFCEIDDHQLRGKVVLDTRGIWSARSSPQAADILNAAEDEPRRTAA